MTKRAFLQGAGRTALLAGSLLLTGFAAWADTAAPRPPAPRRPSIIFILADDLGYGDPGCYGSTQIKTPNLDRMASEGMRFTSCYAGSTVCTPSRAALMLGQHTGHLNLRGNVADLIQRAGFPPVHLSEINFQTMFEQQQLAQAGETPVQ